MGVISRLHGYDELQLYVCLEFPPFLVDQGALRPLLFDKSPVHLSAKQVFDKINFDLYGDFQALALETVDPELFAEIFQEHPVQEGKSQFDMWFMEFEDD